MSINDEWFRYLRAEGYTGDAPGMLIAALQAETGSSSISLPDLWDIYLNQQGYTSAYDWLAAKGYTGGASDMLKAALENNDIFAAALCVAVFSGDAAAGFGRQPATVVGQAISVASSLALTGYLASTDPAEATPLWGSGTRWIEVHDYTLSGTDGTADISAGFIRVDTYIQFRLNVTAPVGAGDPSRVISLYDTIGASTIASVSIGAGTGVVALGIDSSGNCYYDDGSGPVRPGGSFDAAFAASSIALYTAFDFDNAGESGSVSFRTHGADYTLPKFADGDADWCGTALTLWTPDQLFTSGEIGDWWDFRTAYGLYEDVLQTTPTTNGAVVGSAVGRRSWATLEQATTASKPSWVSGELQSGTANRDMTANFTTTFTSATPTSIYAVGRAVTGTTTTTNRVLFRTFSGTYLTSRIQVIGRTDRVLSTVQGVSYTDTGVAVGTSKICAMASDKNTGTNLSYRYNNFLGAYTENSFPGNRNTCTGAYLSLGWSSGNTGAANGLLFINRQLTESETNLLNSYYGV